MLAVGAFEAQFKFCELKRLSAVASNELNSIRRRFLETHFAVLEVHSPSSKSDLRAGITEWKAEKPSTLLSSSEFFWVRIQTFEIQTCAKSFNLNIWTFQNEIQTANLNKLGEWDQKRLIRLIQKLWFAPNLVLPNSVLLDFIRASLIGVQVKRRRESGTKRAQGLAP